MWWIFTRAAHFIYILLYLNSIYVSYFTNLLSRWENWAWGRWANFPIVTNNDKPQTIHFQRVCTESLLWLHFGAPWEPWDHAHEFQKKKKQNSREIGEWCSRKCCVCIALRHLYIPVSGASVSCVHSHHHEETKIWQRIAILNTLI